MLDDKTKALIIKYLRKAWLYSPARRQVIKAAETGEKNEEGEKLYWCNVGYSESHNGNTVTQLPHKVSKVYVDHLESMVPVVGFGTWDSLIDRLFSVPNMQCLCKRHHKIKTDKENKARNLGKKRAKKDDNKRVQTR